MHSRHCSLRAEVDRGSQVLQDAALRSVLEEATLGVTSSGLLAHHVVGIGILVESIQLREMLDILAQDILAEVPGKLAEIVVPVIGVADVEDTVQLLQSKAFSLWQ